MHAHIHVRYYADLILRKAYVLFESSLNYTLYSQTCLKRPLKIDKTKILMTNGSLMKVESIAECSLRSILQK